MIIPNAYNICIYKIIVVDVSQKEKHLDKVSFSLLLDILSYNRYIIMSMLYIISRGGILSLRQSMPLIIIKTFYENKP